MQPDTGIAYYVKPGFSATTANVNYVERDLLSSYYSYYQNMCIQEIHRERYVSAVICGIMNRRRVSALRMRFRRVGGNE